MHDDSGDKNWYVHFYPHYVLTYNKNHADATGSMEQQSVPKDASSKAITIAECRFTRIGYDFVAWNANMNGQGTSYNPGDTYTLNADKTLYAKWAPQQYKIIYKDQGNDAFSGENTTSLPATHTYGTATAIPDGIFVGILILAATTSVVAATVVVAAITALVVVFVVAIVPIAEVTAVVALAFVLLFGCDVVGILR